MKVFNFFVALLLLCAPAALAQEDRDEGRRHWGQGPGIGSQHRVRQPGGYDGIHYGRYRPFYSYPARDCADELRRYNRRTGRMEPSCEVPCVHDRAVDKD
jgi:hypothetical protein